MGPRSTSLISAELQIRIQPIKTLLSRYPEVQNEYSMIPLTEFQIRIVPVLQVVMRIRIQVRVKLQLDPDPNPAGKNYKKNFLNDFNKSSLIVIESSKNERTRTKCSYFLKPFNTIVTIFFFCFFLSTRGPVTETLVWFLTFYECSHFYYKSENI